MLDLQKNRQTLILGVTAISLAILGSGIAYYVVEEDRQVKRRKEGRRAERNTLRLLQQIKEQVQAIETSMKTVEDDIEDKACEDKFFKKKEYTLAHSNELLLQLMEKLDAIRPLTVILGNGETVKESTEFEKNLVSHIKSKKRSVIESIEGLFRRLDIANVKAKKESERREEVAKEKARIEKEEKERIAREEKELEELRKENERKAKEEQERIAQEEGLRRAKEEEQRLAQEALAKELEQEKNKKLEDKAAEAAREDAVLAALKEVEQAEIDKY
jgi:hypothetical protein